MADIGVLSLQIEANAESAVGSLDKLAGALRRLQAAIRGGLELSRVTAQINALGKAVDESISGSTFAKITDLAKAVKELQKSSSATQKINNAFAIDDSAAAQAEAVNAGFAGIAGSVQTARESVEGFNAAMRETSELVQNMDWTGGFEQFSKVLNTWMSMRSSMTLEAGEAGLSADVQQGWTYWKEGAIEVEGTVSEAAESMSGSLGEATQMLLGAGEAAQETASAVESAKASFSGWRVYDMKTGDFTTPLDEFNQRVMEARGNAESLTGSVQNVVESMNAADGSGIRDAADAMAQLGTSSSSLSAIPVQLDRISRAAVNAGTFIDYIRKNLVNIRSAIQDSAVGGFFSQFFRVARYRAIRAVIKSITDGAKEGFENYKKYSEATGNKFSKELKTINAQFATMKNSIGAAIAPALSAAIPIINSIASAATAAFNAVNQLISLLTGGSTWSMPVANGMDASANAMGAASANADSMQKSLRGVKQNTVAYSNAMNDAKEATQGAVSSTKDLLADWDELNIIQSKSGGGGGGGGKTLEDALQQFKEMPFDKTLKMFADTFLEQFGDIWNLVKRIGAALLTWKLSSALLGGLGLISGLLSSGLIIGLTFDLVSVFDKMYLQTGNEGWLLGDVLTTLLGGALATKVLTPLLGGGVAKLALPITLAVSAVASIKALVGEKDVSALSKEGIVTSIVSALEMGAGIGGLVYLAGYTPGMSILYGAGAALAWFGASIGIKATADVYDTGEITSDTIAADLLSALTVGGGLALIEAGVGGTAGTIAGVGIGGALLTFTALIAIQAVIAGKPKGVSWGNYNATASEIKAFVESRMFKASPKVKIDLMNAQVEALGSKKQALQASVQRMLGSFNVLTLSLNPSSLETVKADVAQFVTDFNETADASQKTLELALSLVPATNETGKDVSEQIAGASNERWGKIKGEMARLAKELTDAYEIAYNEDLEEKLRNQAKNTIEKISDIMTEIATAITNGEAKAKATFAMDSQIANLSQTSMDALIETYQQAKEQLIKDLTSARETAAEGLLAQAYAFEELAQDALQKAKGNTEDASYKYYQSLAEEARTDYQTALANIKKDVEMSVQETFEDSEGVAKVRDSLMSMIKKGIVEASDVENLTAIQGTFGFLRKNIYKQLALDDDRGMEIFGKNQVVTWLNELIEQAYGKKDAATIIKAIDSGMIGYGDIIQKEVINALASEIGILEAPPEIQDAWQRLVDELFNVKKPNAEGASETIQEAAQEAAQAATESMAELNEQLEETGVSAVNTEELTESMSTATEAVKGDSENIIQYIFRLSGLSTSGVDSSPLISSLSSTLSSVTSYVNAILSQLSRLRTIGGSYSYGSYRGWPTGAGGGGGQFHSVLGYANGGFPDSGSIFMADENGNIEMKGRMGSQPVVANNEQIISGITRGVENGQEEQNSLLRRQNEILMQLLNKRMVAEVKASSSLGRANARSNSMYGRVTG